MHRVLHDAFQKIEIVRWYECGTDDTFIDCHDTRFALSLLRRFKNDHLSMATLRNAFSEFLYAGTHVCRLTDDVILQQLAMQIVQGHIRLVTSAVAIPRGTSPGTSSKTTAETSDEEAVVSEAQSAAPAQPSVPEPAAIVETPEAVAEPVEEPAEEPTEESPESEPALIPAGLAAAQAATIMTAAASGAPFCEP